MKKLAIIIILFALGLNVAHAVEVNDWGKIVGETHGTSCHYLSSVDFNANGLVNLKFLKSTTSLCREENQIVLAKTNPPNQIASVTGIQGSDIINKKSFIITVTPRTLGLNVHLYQWQSKIQVRGFDIQKHIRLLKEATSGWQNAWKQSEKKLQAQKSADRTPPRINISSPSYPSGQKVVRLDSYQTYIRGKAVDNEGIVQILVNGRKAGLKADGSFASKVKLKLGVNKVRIQAEDVNGNVGERILTVIREEFIPEETLADVDMPPKTRMNNPNGVAVVIGVENYQYVSDATYAYNDAEVFREYLADTLGYKKSKIKIVTNSKATLAELNKLLGPNGWIARNVKAKTSDVVVYFSGHGIPDAKTKKTGLLPFDVDPNYSVGMTLRDLYTTLGTLDAKSVTVFLDTCFSGQGREKQSLLADARGIMVVPLEKNIPKPMTVFSAATAGQISGPLKDKEHGLFTYYVLKGLGGAADSNKDKQLTVSELGSYVQSNVKEQAAAKGWNQTPELQGASNRVLVRW